MIRRALSLKERRETMLLLLKELNECNAPSPDNYLAPCVPSEVLSYVDQKLAAKGLISLLVESIALTEKDLEALGVDLSEETVKSNDSSPRAA
jgi:hypothetical protein